MSKKLTTNRRQVPRGERIFLEIRYQGSASPSRRACAGRGWGKVRKGGTPSVTKKTRAGNRAESEGKEYLPVKSYRQLQGELGDASNSIVGFEIRTKIHGGQSFLLPWTGLSPASRIKRGMSEKGIRNYAGLDRRCSYPK